MHPALQRRSALRERRPYALRRHTGRVATRFAVLFSGDVVAIMIARSIALWIATDTLGGSIAFATTPLLVGGSKLIFFGLLTLAAVFATGGHSRHRALNQPVRLFVAVVGAVLITWAGGIARGFLPDLILPMVVTVDSVWLSLLLVRQVSEWFLRHVWPAQRGSRRRDPYRRSADSGTIRARHRRAGWRLPRCRIRRYRSRTKAPILSGRSTIFPP